MLEMLVREDECVLVDDPTYSGILAYLEATGSMIIGVETDGDGESQLL